MKKLLGSTLIVLILSVTAGCMNPFDGGNGEKSGGAVSGADEVAVDVEITIGDRFGASSIYDTPVLGDGQHYWVELEVFSSAGRRISFKEMELVDGKYRASLTLQPGLLTFVVSSRIYTWNTDVSDYRYYGEKSQQINSGVVNSVSIATSSYDLLCSIVEINNIPAGYNSVIVGLVESGFNLYSDIISPYRASGFSDRALMSIISQIWIASGHAQVVTNGSARKAEARLMRGIDSVRPWQQEGTFNVFVMLQNEHDMWIPGSVDGEGSFTPFIGSATFAAGGEFFGAIGLFTANHYRGFHYLIAEEGGVIVDVNGVLKKQNPEDPPPVLLDATGDAVTTASSDWMLFAAVFPKNWNVFDEEGKIAPDTHPIAMGSAAVDLNHIGFDGTASLPLLMHYEDGSGVGDLKVPWTGIVGNQYDVYILLAAETDPEPDEPMYVAGQMEDSVFRPHAFVFTFESVPAKVQGNVAGMDFREMVHTEF